MRLAFIGKGGTGKSMLAGTTARILAHQGHRVVALDIDTIPGMAYSLGLGATDEGRLPEELAERREGEGWVMREPVPVTELIDRYAARGPDGILYLQLGKMPGRVRPGSSAAFRYVSEGLAETDWTVVADLSGGTRQPYFGWAGFASRFVVVAEPYAAALMTARRLTRASETAPQAQFGLIMNKTRGDGTTAAGTSLPLWAEVPYDDEVARAEREGKATFDLAPHSGAVQALTRFVMHTLSSEERR